MIISQFVEGNCLLSRKVLLPLASLTAIWKRKWKCYPLVCPIFTFEISISASYDGSAIICESKSQFNKADTTSCDELFHSSKRVLPLNRLPLLLKRSYHILRWFMSSALFRVFPLLFQDSFRLALFSISTYTHSPSPSIPRLFIQLWKWQSIIPTTKFPWRGYHLKIFTRQPVNLHPMPRRKKPKRS